MDVITEVFKRVVGDVKQEIRNISYKSIVIVLTLVVLVSLVIPSWVLLIAVIAGWGLIAKDNYDDFIAWATDSPEDDNIEEQKPVDTEEQK